ncbi:DNA polymerase I [Rhodococcus sp. IEGM 1408]|uniref:DNA polymerase I n=1 Tax=Rhodococcus sp. IEGM 1408 TaxID=3082220 RepID=UPI0029529D5B|nr:DNA polymerase I [Rhodococcus sp. IEGM 1408]MDV8001747.1 DNA polymerase I [Rhodococcus sp. IEGM 1408]
MSTTSQTVDSSTTSAAAAGGDGPARLLLLDGHSLAFRAFYALPAENFSTASGQHTNAVYGFLSMVANLITTEKPTHLAAAFDVSRATLHRTAEYPEYKSTRSAVPEEFKGQVDLIQEALSALGVRTLSLEGHEADDLIATLATQAAGTDTLICTGDRDAFQLVSDSVTVLYPVKGVSELARYTPEAVEAKYGVTPAQYPDVAALRGDTSDNLPGVPKVGDKTAAKWIVQYGSLSDLIAHADEVKGKVGESFREHLPQVQLNRRITQLTRDLDLGVELDDLARHDPERADVNALFDRLEFGPLARDRFLTAFLPEGATEPVAEVELEQASVLHAGEVSDWLAAHAPAGKRHGLVVVGPSRPGAGDAQAVTVAAAGGASGHIDLARIDPSDEQALRAWLADDAVAKAVHDSKAATHALMGRDLALGGVSIDVALAAYLVRPGQRSYGLAELFQRHLQRELPEAEAGEKQLSLLDEVDEAEVEQQAANSAATRARAVLDIAERLDVELEQVHGARLLAEMELPLVPALARMESIGIAVDSAALDDLRDGFTDRGRDAADAAYAAIGGEQINLGSPKQLQVVLFETLGMPKTKKTKTGYTTDAKALEELLAKETADTPGRAFLEALLLHREATKMRTTVEGLIKTIGDDGRIHTTFNQTVAATGRLSSTDPNLQNIPVRTEDGRRIRKSFVVGEGYDCLLTADYSQIEMRVMAHLSKDAGLIEAFRTGEDLHSFVGSRAFGVPIDQVTPELRRRVKAMSYGLAYGLSAFGLAAQLGIGQNEAREQMDAYFSRFGGVRDYLHTVVDQARRDGYTETLFGRRRYLPELNSDNRLKRENAERAALNAPIQGSAADIIKAAMLKVDADLTERGLRSRLLLQVHDELVLEVAKGELDEVRGLVVDRMYSAIELDVPLDVSTGTGPDWDSAAH